MCACDIMCTKDRVNEPLAHSLACSLSSIPGFTIMLIPNWKKWAFGYNTYNFSNFSTAVPLPVHSCNNLTSISSSCPYIRSSVPCLLVLLLAVVPVFYSHILSRKSPSARLTIAIVKNVRFRYMSNSSLSSIWLINYWPHVNSWIANQQSVQLNANTHTRREREGDRGR